MCSEPPTIDGNTFACRRCNECIKARKNDWVARCMAEKSTSGEAVAIELTYRNNADGSMPEAAQAFRYKDVEAFFNRLRQAYFREYKVRGEIRFICAGERGSQKGRVHWHLIVFGDRKFSNLGQWHDFVFKQIDGPIFSQPRKKAVMLQWGLWPHGHVVIKEGNQETFAYAVKYALKDQFNVVKSKGTMRESKAENHGASYFRMSKQPPIGFRFLERMCDSWDARLVVPTSLHLKVPDYSGFWWPKGQLREYLLDRLFEINERRKELLGRDAPQWFPLLASLESVEKDWETLVYGPQQENHEEYAIESWQRRLAEAQEKRLKQWRDSEEQRCCGGIRVCRLCWRGKEKEERARYRAWYSEQVAEYVTDESDNLGTLDKWFREKGQFNPHCIPRSIGQD